MFRRGIKELSRNKFLILLISIVTRSVSEGRPNQAGVVPRLRFGL